MNGRVRIVAAYIAVCEREGCGDVSPAARTTAEQAREDLVAHENIVHEHDE